MRMKTQNLLGIVPLFLGLALGIAALTFYLYEREIRWALAEEANGLSLTIGSFISGEQFLRMANGAAEKTAREDIAGEDLFMRLDRILAVGRAKRIFGFTLGDHKLVFDVGPQKGTGEEAPFPRGLADRIEGESFAATDIRRLPLSGEHIVQSFSPIRDARRQVVGILGVHVDAGIFAQQVSRWGFQSLRGLVAALLIGMVCALVISSVMQRRIAVLNAAVSAAAEGDYEASVQSDLGLIRETNDLSNTFNTMISILRGVVAQTRRDIVNVTQFRTEENLRETLIQEYFKPKHVTQAGLTAFARIVHKGRRGMFFELLAAEDAVCALLGQAGAGHGLEQALQASAAANYARQHLADGDTRALVEAMTSLFNLEQLQILQWKVGADTLTVSRLDRTGIVQTEDVPFTSDTAVFHNLDTEAGRRVDLYLKTFPRGSPEKLMDELAHVVETCDASDGGVLILLSRVAA